MTAALEISDLAVGYPRRQVIGGLTVPPLPGGTITAVVGPNAAGKTTLLRALAGLLPATGAARYDGRNLLDLKAPEFARLVAYVPQILPQGVALTVLESVVTALRLTPAADDRPTCPPDEAAEAALSRLGIAHLALSPLDELSGGQRQLVSLAQALVRSPRILLLDEPTSALDPHHQIAVMEAVRERAGAEGMVVVAVLHDLNLALRWADTAILLSQGRVLAAGPPEETVTAGNLAAAYRVSARVERCSQGWLHVLYDGTIARTSL